MNSSPGQGKKKQNKPLSFSVFHIQILRQKDRGGAIDDDDRQLFKQIGHTHTHTGSISAYRTYRRIYTNTHTQVYIELSVIIHVEKEGNTNEKALYFPCVSSLVFCFFLALAYLSLPLVCTI